MFGGKRLSPKTQILQLIVGNRDPLKVGYLILQKSLNNLLCEIEHVSSGFCSNRAQQFQIFS